MDELIAYLIGAIDRVGALILYLSGAIILLFIIWGGIQYMQGDAESGKKTITSAVIGAAIITLAAMIINTVTYLINK
ncbi:hypothetical protein KKE14_01765 [Patescibacteria group bacterium]|nr:hypothetical protein [Patescibacteria group bacterium]